MEDARNIRSTNTSRISELRKAGNLDEAYKLACADLQADMNDPWAQMSLFYVLRDMCKKAIEAKNTDKAKKMLDGMERLCPTMKDDMGLGPKICTSLYRQLLPESVTVNEAAEKSKSDAAGAYDMVKDLISNPENVDASLHNSLGWILYRYIRASIDSLTGKELRTLLSYYIKLEVERPSILHSQMLAVAISIAKKHDDFNFAVFFKLWNPCYLRGEDIQKGKGSDGKEYSSLLSRACRQIVGSNGEVDLDSLPDNLRKLTAEALREAEYWKLYEKFKNNEIGYPFFSAFTTYNDKYASYGPSEWHSQVLRLALRVMDGNNSWRFFAFFKAWGIDNLTDDDWQGRTDAMGNEYPSTAAKATKRCYEWLKDQQHKDKENIAWLASLYDIAIEHNPDDEWLMRQRAIIYLWQDDRDSALQIYRELVLQLGDKYYIWSELANLIDDNDMRIALLSKALLLEKNEDYLGSIHLTLACELIKKGMKAEALCELTTYEATHENPSRRCAELRKAVGEGVTPAESNKVMYSEKAVTAEDYAYGDIEPVNVVVVQKYEDHGKRVTVLYDGADIRLRIKDNAFPMIKQSKIGNVFTVRSHEGKMLSIRPASNDACLPNFKEAIVAVTNVDDKKGCFFFTLGEGYNGVTGRVSFKDTSLRPTLGQCLKVRYCVMEGKDGKQRLLTTRIETTNEVNDKAVKRISGRLRVKFRPDSTGIQPDFAFIDNYYVHRSLLRKYNIIDDCDVSADVVYNDKGKWNAVDLIL